MRQQEVLSRRNRSTRVLVAVFLAIATLLGLAIRPTPSAHADTIDSSILSTTQSNAAIVATDTTKSTNVVTIAYTALAGDVVTITIPDGYIGTITTDTALPGSTLEYKNASGAKTTSAGLSNGLVKTITLTFTQAMRVAAFRVNLTPKLPVEMSNASKVNNPLFMQEGTFVLGVQAKTTDRAAGSGTATYAANATFTTSAGPYSMPEWKSTTYVLNNASFVKGFNYSLDIYDAAIAILSPDDSAPTSQRVYVRTMNAKSIHLMIPGGFVLDAAAEAAGWSQTGTDLFVWTNPDTSGAISQEQALNLTGAFTGPVGSYTGTTTGSYIEGYPSYSDTPVQIPLQKSWTMNIVAAKAPKVSSGSYDRQALIGTDSNVKHHLSDVSYESTVGLGLDTEDESNVAFDVPIPDGSALVGGKIEVYANVGDSVNVTWTKNPGSPGDTGQELELSSATPVSGTYKDGSPNAFLVDIPLRTVSDPYLSMHVTITHLSKRADKDAMTFTGYYQALTTKTAGTALSSGDRGSGNGTISGTGTMSGAEWGPVNITASVLYWDSPTVQGNVVCGGVTASESPEGATGCRFASGSNSTIGMSTKAGVIGTSSRLSRSMSFEQGAIVNDPIVYYLLPLHADYTSTNVYGRDANLKVNFISKDYNFQEPNITTSTVNGQTLVKLDWTGLGPVKALTLQATNINYSIPSNLIDGDSSIATWISVPNATNPGYKTAAIADAIRTDVSEITTSIQKTDPSATLVGSMNVNVTGAKTYSGNASITDNTGASSTSAVNKLNDGLTHGIQMQIFNNASTLTGVTGLINLPSDSDGLGLQLTGKGSVTDDTGNAIADTGASSDTVYLMYSTSTQTPPSSSAIVSTAGYVRASAVTDWSSIRSVILYAPEQLAQTWYDANLPVTAKNAASQLFQQVSMTYYLSNASLRYDPDVTLTDMFYDFSGTMTWDDDNDVDGLRPDSSEVTLYSGTTPLGTVTASPDTSAGADANVWKYSFDSVPVDSVIAGASKYTVKQTTVMDGYTESVNGLNITNTHVVGPCTVRSDSVPSPTDCSYLANNDAVKSGSAYEYATVGGSGGEVGFSGLLGDASLAADFVTDNDDATISWNFAVQTTGGSSDLTTVGSYVVDTSAGEAFADGHWEWTKDVPQYLAGVGSHQVVVSLKVSTNPDAVVTTWGKDIDPDNEAATTKAVDVFVPLAKVVDSQVELGQKAQIADNLAPGVGGLATGLFWSNGISGNGNTPTDNNLTPVAPKATLQAVYNGEGTDPGKVLEAGDEFTPYTGTTFKVRVILSSDAVAQGAKDALGTATTNAGETGAIVGPAGYTEVINDPGSSDGIEAQGLTLLSNSLKPLNIMLNTSGSSIGAPLATAPEYGANDGTKAAFTVYVTGTLVSTMPLTGADGLGRTILLITLGTLLTAGFIAGASWWTRRSCHSSHVLSAV